MKAQELGWLGHGSHREADAFVSGYKYAQKKDWRNQLLHDMLIQAFCSGVWT